jgi:hypothetical protein
LRSSLEERPLGRVSKDELDTVADGSRRRANARLLTMRNHKLIRSDYRYFHRAALIERSTVSLGQQSTLSPAFF